MRAFLLRLAWIVPLVAVLVVVGAATMRTGRGASITAALGRGDRPLAPAFQLPAFDGRTLELAAFRGRPVVINFWASWCGPCKDEAPLLERVWRTYRARGVTVIGVDIQDLEADARRFIADNGVTYPNVRDREGRISRAYGITGVPETFFVAADGRIVSKFPGAVVVWQTWEDAIGRLLANDVGE